MRASRRNRDDRVRRRVERANAFDRDLAADALILRDEDLAHAAFADQLAELVAGVGQGRERRRAPRWDHRLVGRQSVGATPAAAIDCHPPSGLPDRHASPASRHQPSRRRYHLLTVEQLGRRGPRHTSCDACTVACAGTGLFDGLRRGLHAARFLEPDAAAARKRRPQTAR